MPGLPDIATALQNLNTNIGALTKNTALSVIVDVAHGGTGASDAAGARSNLGLGQASTLNVIDIAHGGTGQTTAGAGTANGIGALAISFNLADLQSTSSARSNLGLGTLATQNSTAVSITGGTITGLTQLGLGPSGGGGSGTNFVAQPGSAGTTSVQIAAQGGARTYTVPDQGGNATVLMTGASVGGSGLTAFPIPLFNFKNSDGTGLAAAASAGKFGISLTLGTSRYLVSEAANSNTKTDVALIELTLPPNYIAGKDVTITANCNYVVGTGTVGTHTLTAVGYLVGNNGTMGANLIATAAQSVPSAAGDALFTITGTTLVPGSLLILALTLVIQETAAGGNITAQINSVRVS